jgi:hypothetical protein
MRSPLCREPAYESSPAPILRFMWLHRQPRLSLMAAQHKQSNGNSNHFREAPNFENGWRQFNHGQKQNAEVETQKRHGTRNMLATIR